MNFKRIITFILAAAMLLGLLTGCAPAAQNDGESAEDSADSADSENSAENSADAAETITITDHAGNEVTLPAQIDRIAIVGIWPLASVLTIFFNSAEKLVGIPEASMTAAQNGLLGQLYPEILDADTSFITDDTLNTEELLKLDPQVVFYNAASTQMGEQLKTAGFNAVAVGVNQWDYDCIETLNQWISLLSKIFPENDKADLVRTRSQEMYDLVQKRVSGLSDAEKARVFVLFKYTDTMMATSGSSFFGQWWCDAIGALNVANEIDADNAVQVNMEQVYAWNPDTILITNFTSAMPEDLYTNAIGASDWSGIDAVVNKNAHKMPLGMYRSYTPGADTPVTLLWMAKAVYPALFEDIDVTQQAKDYYHEVFGVELTDEQIESIFAPSAAAAGGVN